MRNGKGECLLEWRQKMQRCEHVGCLTLGSQGGGCVAKAALLDT